MKSCLHNKSSKLFLSKASLVYTLSLICSVPDPLSIATQLVWYCLKVKSELAFIFFTNCMGHLFHEHAVYAPPFSLIDLCSSLIPSWLTITIMSAQIIAFLNQKTHWSFLKHLIHNKTHVVGKRFNFCYVWFKLTADVIDTVFCTRCEKRKHFSLKKKRSKKLETQIIRGRGGSEVFAGRNNQTKDNNQTVQFLLDR